MASERFFGVASVRWELPFMLRLPPRCFLCWEPQEAVATFVGFPRIGEINWGRTSSLLDSAKTLGALYQAEPARALPDYEYTAAGTIDGQDYPSMQLLPGTAGGFREIHAYTVATLFLCVNSQEEFVVDRLMARASASLNSLLSLHSFLAADGWSRPLRPDLDSYYTVFSLATVPNDWPDLDARALLMRLQELHFGNEVGRTRAHSIGLNSPDDLTIRPFEHALQAEFASRALSQTELAIHQQLLLSSLRRLRMREFNFAVIDANTAVEVCIGNMLRRAMRARGSSVEQIEGELSGRLGSLEQRIVHLDKLAKASAQPGRRFGESVVWKAWKKQLAGLRHAIVHHGRRDVMFAEAKDGIAAALRTITFIEDMFPALALPVQWGDGIAELRNVNDSAGKLLRVFTG